MAKFSFNPEESFNNLPFLPPKNFKESEKILRQLVLSHKVLAELKGYSELLPNKNIILNSITLQEAKDSSEIENIITTQDELFKAIALQKKIDKPEIKEVLNYRNAIFTGLNHIKKNNILTTNFIIEIQGEIENNSAGIRKLPGTKLINDNTSETMYTPPDNEKNIRDLLANLEIFINDESAEPDPLIKMAMLHYQFEAIHPFYDGNGRTGRILNVLYLVLKGLLNEPFLYLSDYIIKTKSEYYRLLRSVATQNNWEEWILYILKAVEKTSVSTLVLSKKIIALLESAADKIRKERPKIYSRELLEILFSNVYSKISHLTDAKIASRNIAANYLKELEKIGLLAGEKIGREVIYVNKELFNLLKGK